MIDIIFSYGWELILIHRILIGFEWIRENPLPAPYWAPFQTPAGNLRQALRQQTVEQRRGFCQSAALELPTACTWPSGTAWTLCHPRSRGLESRERLSRGMAEPTRWLDLENNKMRINFIGTGILRDKVMEETFVYILHFDKYLTNSVQTFQPIYNLNLKELSFCLSPSKCLAIHQYLDSGKPWEVPWKLAALLPTCEQPLTVQGSNLLHWQELLHSFLLHEAGSEE